ncbi:hemerythrin domain-containing protein [Sunxiuqinia sp. A32]|uniref:hemerythrin domain-containing protein n=1 Tax=Sunxiuqinia sp. A32 TaxID=3461496 RepID=UPI004045790A
MEIIHKDMKMSDLIYIDHYFLLVIERFGIKLGVSNRTIEEICTEYQISIKVFLSIVHLHLNPSLKSTFTFNTAELKNIVNYLINSHEYYLKEVFPEIIKNIQLMSTNSNKPEMLMVETFFNEYKNEVEQHFDYENQTVFPYILKLIGETESPNDEAVYSVVDYKEHHDDIQEKLDDLTKLLIEHLPQKTDNTFRRKILFLLFDLDYDLQIHAKIENEILIPATEYMESLQKS